MGFIHSIFVHSFYMGVRADLVLAIFGVEIRQKKISCWVYFMKTNKFCLLSIDLSCLHPTCLGGWVAGLTESLPNLAWTVLGNK